MTRSEIDRFLSWPMQDDQCNLTFQLPQKIVQSSEASIIPIALTSDWPCGHHRWAPSWKSAWGLDIYMIAFLWGLTYEYGLSMIGLPRQLGHFRFVYFTCQTGLQVWNRFEERGQLNNMFFRSVSLGSGSNCLQDWIWWQREFSVKLTDGPCRLHHQLQTSAGAWMTIDSKTCSDSDQSYQC